MEEYKKVEHQHEETKQRQYWEAAIGLQAVDNLKPSDYLKELSEENIKGNIPTSKVYEKLSDYYNKSDIVQVERTKECDIVSARIVELLEVASVSLNPAALKSIHKYLFEDIYDFAGKFREYNITKDEPVLSGKSVVYSDYRQIQSILEYDFSVEKEQKYAMMTNDEFVKHISKFTSSIWQVHPFGEGNTRTTAVFMELYLNSLGFEINNDMFKEHSLYFRNALVRSNYANYREGIDVDFSFLEMFYENLLFKGNHNLHEQNLYA